MPSSAVRVLELKFQVDTTQFVTGIQIILAGIRNVRQAMGTLGSTGISVARSFNVTTNSFNRTTTALRGTHAAANNAKKGFGALFMETKGGLRVFGGESGLLKAFALVRNHLLLLAFGFGPFIYAIKSAVQASVEFTNAMTGLGAIAKATGEKIDVTQNAAKSLAEKGFMTVTEAAMGLKNLLATGFGLEDAMKIMKGFTDSAAFNRQASFQWGEAVVRATEGIRLGLSQVSDAAGITKNLSQILKEQGKSMQDVSKISSDASVRQALLNGLMQEFTLYAGNAELALGTYSGSLSVFKTSLFNLKKEIGDSLVPVLAKLVKGLSDSVKEATRWYKINKEIIDLKLQGFIDIAEPIKNFVVFLAKATAGMINFVATHKELVVLLLVLKSIHKVIISIATILVRAGVAKFGAVIKELAVLWSGVRTLSGASAALGVTIRAILGPLGILLSIVTALGLAFIAFKKHQESVTKNALENNATMTKQVKLYQEQINMRISAARAELDNVKSRQELEGATGYLLSEEQKLIDKLQILEGQAKATNLQLEKIALTQSMIQFGGTEKDIMKDRIVGGWAREGYTRPTSVINPLRRFYSQLDTQGLYSRIQGTSTPEEWAKRVSEAESAYNKMLEFGVTYYRVLGEEDRKNFDELTKIHSQMLTMSKSQIVTEIENKKKKTGLTEDELKELKKKEEAYYDLYDKISDKYFKSVSSEFEYKKWVLAQEVAEYKKSLREMEVSKERFEKTSLLIQQTYSVERQKLIYEELNALKRPNMKGMKNVLRPDELGLVPYGRQKEEIDTGVTDYVTESLEKQKEQLKKGIDITADYVAQIANAYWSEREQINQARNAELDDLRRQLDQGIIDTSEYTARRNQIMYNADIQAANATRKMWRDVTGSVFNMMGQMVQNYIVETVKAANTTQAILIGGAAGLGVGLLVAGGTYLASKAFAEKPTVDYESINPSSTSESARKRYGSIQSAPVQYINVIPTLNFEAVNGSYILIGSGTVEEFSDEVSQLIKNTVNAAIESNEIGLSGLAPQ